MFFVMPSISPPTQPALECTCTWAGARADALLRRRPSSRAGGARRADAEDGVVEGQGVAEAVGGVHQVRRGQRRAARARARSRA